MKQLVVIEQQCRGREAPFFFSHAIIRLWSERTLANLVSVSSSATAQNRRSTNEIGGREPVKRTGLPASSHRGSRSMGSHVFLGAVTLLKSAKPPFKHHVCHWLKAVLSLAQDFSYNLQSTNCLSWFAFQLQNKVAAREDACCVVFLRHDLASNTSAKAESIDSFSEPWLDHTVVLESRFWRKVAPLKRKRRKASQRTSDKVKAQRKARLMTWRHCSVTSVIEAATNCTLLNIHNSSHASLTVRSFLGF